MNPLRIGTRGSRLALFQAALVRKRLAESGFGSTIIPIQTTGDRRRDVSLATIGGKGVFIKEIEEALVDGRIDLAVHSLKDVPTMLSERFRLAAFLERGDPRDAWIHRDGKRLAEAGQNAVVGTSSPRRRAQLLHLHPGLRVQEIRGNVETRLSRACAGDLDAVILAAAGLQRLEKSDRITEWLDPGDMVPAAGQGIIVVETLEDPSELNEAISCLNHPETAIAAGCERGVLEQFGTRLDCYSAIAVHAAPHNGRWVLSAFVSDLEGKRPIKVRKEGSAESINAMIREVAAEMIAAGAMERLAESHRG